MAVRNTTTINTTSQPFLSGQVTFIAGTNITIVESGQSLTINSSAAGGVTSITGTANQIIASSPTGAVTLSTPQDIATTSSPTFGGIKLSGSGGTFNVKINSVTINALEDITSDASPFQSLLESHTNTGASCPQIAFIRSRGTAAVPTISQINDAIGFETFYGYTGSATVGYQPAAQVQYWICADGTTVSTTSMPGRIQLFTTPDLSTTPVERVRINCTGLVTFFSNINMNGTIVYGNFGTSSGNLTLAANNSSFLDTNTGRINIKERLVFNESFTVAGTSFTDSLIDLNGTFTSGVAVNVVYGLRHRVTLRYSVIQILSQSPGIWSSPGFQPTVGVTDNLSEFGGFLASPVYSPDNTGTNITPLLYGYLGSSVATRTNAGATVTVTELTNFKSYGNFVFANQIQNCTVTQLNHFKATTPGITSATITEHTGLRIDSLISGTSNIGIRSAMTSGATNWFLYGVGTASSAHVGKFMLGSVVTPTNILSIDGQSAQIIWMERQTTANTAGNSLTLQSGGATSGATDKAAGNLILSPGVSTGTGKMEVNIKGYTRALATGTSDNTQTDRMVIGAQRTLTNSSAIAIINATVANNTSIGGSLWYWVEVVNAAGARQTESGFVTWIANNNAGTVTTTTPVKSGNVQNATTGTLTVAFAASTANPSVISCTVTSSLTPSSGYPRIIFNVLGNTDQAAAIQ